jgi:hypothetical protein
MSNSLKSVVQKIEVLIQRLEKALIRNMGCLGDSFRIQNFNWKIELNLISNFIIGDLILFRVLIISLNKIVGKVTQYLVLNIRLLSINSIGKVTHKVLIILYYLIRKRQEIVLSLYLLVLLNHHLNLRNPWLNHQTRSLLKRVAVVMVEDRIFVWLMIFLRMIILVMVNLHLIDN